MHVTGRVAFAIVLGAGACLAGCETSDDEHLVSRFAPAPQEFFQIAGRVRRDQELVPNAVVTIDATPLTPKLGMLTDVTSASGLYRFVDAPFRYDVNVVTGLELTTYRHVGVRYFEPLLAGSAPPRGHTAHVTVVLEPAPPSTHDIVFSVSGDPDVLGVTGDAARGLDVAFRTFTKVQKEGDPACTGGIRIHAVEIAKGTTLASPIAYGKTCVPSIASGGLETARIVLDTIKSPPLDVTVQAEVPAGMTADAVDIVLDFGLRYLLMPVTQIALGGTARFVRIPDVRYALRARAHKGRATSDSGHTFFEPNDKVITAVLPAPISARGPIDDGGALRFELDQGEGVRELAVVAAAADAPSVRVVSTDATIVTPDPRTLGLPPMHGIYTFRVRRWPKLPFTESLSGSEARETSPFAESESFDFPR